MCVCVCVVCGVRACVRTFMRLGETGDSARAPLIASLISRNGPSYLLSGCGGGLAVHFINSLAEYVELPNDSAAAGALLATVLLLQTDCLQRLVLQMAV